MQGLHVINLDIFLCNLSQNYLTLFVFYHINIYNIYAHILTFDGQMNTITATVVDMILQTSLHCILCIVRYLSKNESGTKCHHLELYTFYSSLINRRNGGRFLVDFRQFAIVNLEVIKIHTCILFSVYSLDILLDSHSDMLCLFTIQG